MAALLIEAAARAFGMIVFFVVFLWLSHGAFPGNWVALVALYALCIPVAVVYGWLSDAPPSTDVGGRRPRMPKLLLVAIGAGVVIFGYGLFKAHIDTLLYSGS